VEQLRALIRDVPDFPAPGILFRDLTPLLADGPAFREVVRRLAEPVRSLEVDVVAGVESRGFLFGAPLALEIHVDAISPGQRVLLVDDLLATGGTARAAVEMVRELGGDLVGVSFVVELTDLGGRALLADTDVFSLISY
jgi:adenine phosphoribosyltransferase